MEFCRAAAAPLANKRLNEAIIHCHQCSFHKKAPCRTRTGGYCQAGAEHATILVIGEVPHETLQFADNNAVHPLAGTEGYALLQEAWKTVGINDDHAYYINAMCCKSGLNKMPLQADLKHCQSFFAYAWRLINPIAVVCLGQIAFESVMGMSLAEQGHRGKWMDRFGTPVIGTHNPQYLFDFADIYSRESIEEFRKDIHDDLTEVARKIGEISPSDPVLSIKN